MNFRPQKCSSRTHSRRSYPHFSPHVTLATFSSPPPIPLAELLPMVKATPVYFESLRVGNSYLGSLSVVISRSREFMDLYDYTVRHLKQAHGIHVTSHSFPRMPLFFLDEAVHGERHRLAEILRTSGRVIEGRGIELNCTLDGAAPEFDAMTGFFGSELWLVDCSGAVASWKVLEKRKLIRRGPRMPMSAPLLCGPNSGPVIPVPSHRRFSGCMPPVPYMHRGEPFSYKPKPPPVIPVPVYHSQEPR